MYFQVRSSYKGFDLAQCFSRANNAQNINYKYLLVTGLSLPAVDINALLSRLYLEDVGYPT